MAIRDRKEHDLVEGRYADIINAAGELFAEHGFAGTSLQNIADAVGVLKGSLYHYISSKEELLFEVIRVAHQGLHENIRIADRFASDPRRQLTAFCYGHVTLNAVIERIHRGTVFLRDIKNLNVTEREMITQDRDRYDSYLRSILTRGQAANLFDPELDPRISAFSITGVITSYIRWFRPGGSITPHHIGRDAAAFVLSAVIAAPKIAGERFVIADEVIAQFQAERDAGLVSD